MNWLTNKIRVILIRKKENGCWIVPLSWEGQKPKKLAKLSFFMMAHLKHKHTNNTTYMFFLNIFLEILQITEHWIKIVENWKIIMKELVVINESNKPVKYIKETSQSSEMLASAGWQGVAESLTLLQFCRNIGLECENGACLSLCVCVWRGVSQQLKSTYKGGRVPWERARRTENELLNVAVAFLGKFCLVISSSFIVMVTANTYRNSIIRNCSHPCLTMKTLCPWICQPRSTKAKQALFSYRTCSLRYCLVLCSNVSPLIPGDANQSTWPR